MNWFNKERQEELKIIMKEDYNLEMSDEEAKEFGPSLVGMFDLIYNADKAKSSSSVLSGYIDEGIKENVK